MFKNSKIETTENIIFGATFSDAKSLVCLFKSLETFGLCGFLLDEKNITFYKIKPSVENASIPALIIISNIDSERLLYYKLESKECNSPSLKQHKISVDIGSFFTMIDNSIKTNDRIYLYQIVGENFLSISFPDNIGLNPIKIPIKEYKEEHFKIDFNNIDISASFINSEIGTYVASLTKSLKKAQPIHFELYNKKIKISSENRELLPKEWKDEHFTETGLGTNFMFSPTDIKFLGSLKNANDKGIISFGNVENGRFLFIRIPLNCFGDIRILIRNQL